LGKDRNPRIRITLRRRDAEEDKSKEEKGERRDGRGREKNEESAATIDGMTPNQPGQMQRLPCRREESHCRGFGKGGVGSHGGGEPGWACLAGIQDRPDGRRRLRAQRAPDDGHQPDAWLWASASSRWTVRRELIPWVLKPGDNRGVRGPMLHSVIQQFLRGDWETGLSHHRLPPAPGTCSFSLIQTAPITGAIVVTTPSDVSLEDARKAVTMSGR